MTEPPQIRLTNPVSRRFSAIELLIAVAALFISFPFIEKLRAAPLIESILLTVVLVSAILAIAGRRWVIITAGALALPAVAGRWIHDYRPDLLPAEVFLISAILFVIFVIGNLLWFVLRAPSVTLEVLCASISAYLLFGLLWTFGYWLVAELVPGAFSFNVAAGAEPSIQGFNGLYFSFITLSTVGYGDITPVASAARMLAAAEAMTGLLYVAVLIARLVALHASPKPNEN